MTPVKEKNIRKKTKTKPGKKFFNKPKNSEN